MIISSKHDGINPNRRPQWQSESKFTVPPPIWNTNLAIWIQKVFLPCTLAISVTWDAVSRYLADEAIFVLHSFPGLICKTPTKVLLMLQLRG